MSAADRSSQSPRARRSSTNDPEAFAKGGVQTGQEAHSSKYDDVNAGVKDYEGKENYHAPPDGGGMYSKPRKS